MRKVVLTALVVLLRVGAASAQGLGAQLEVGAGTMLSAQQQNRDPNLLYGNTPGQMLGVQASLRVGFRLPAVPLAVEAGVSAWMFPSDTAPLGLAMGYLAGIRFDPRVGRIGRIVVDVHGGVSTTGELLRPMLDVGAGFDFRVVRGFGLGPMLRYGRIFQTESPSYYPDDAQFWSIGLAASVRPDDPAPPPPPDTDLDGVVDAHDECPTEPAGARPDPARAGCPLNDTDGDGVMDGVDQCPRDPAGEHPDPARAGCPLRDTDGDGVFDSVDQCPHEPQGAAPDPDRVGCPDGDRDHDGVADHRDLCPAEPAGVRPDWMRAGCPMGDRDHDGVADDVDHCPDQPGAPDPNPARNGCPGLVLVEAGQIRINRPVFFASRRDTILRRSFAVLQAVANALAAVPSIRHVSIEGHTDDVGRDDANMDLSNRRARSVMAWLILHGVEATRLEAHGFGETRPLMADPSRAARAANRRVEFRIADPEARATP